MWYVVEVRIFGDRGLTKILKDMERWAKWGSPMGILPYKCTSKVLIVTHCPEFLRHAECWAEKDEMHTIAACVDKHIIQLEYIYTHVEPDYQIAAICCTAHQRHDCIRQEMTKLCDKDNAEFVMEAIEGSNAGVTEFACDSYTSFDACDSEFNSTIWEPLKDVVNTNDERLLAKRHRHRSSLAPTLAIITQFDM